MDDHCLPSKSHSTFSDSTGSGKADVTDSGGTMTLAPLKSIQPYRTQDEFLVAMKEDLAEWLNTAYNLDMDENSLFAQLATGVLLCRHANAFNAVATDAGTVASPPRRNSGIATSTSGFNPSISHTSGACPSTTSGGVSSASSVVPFSTVHFRDGAQPGSFQSRDNIANFLGWCRSSLGLRDTLLFETEDLVKGRNERNVVLCLLEVARRGSRLGMAAPSLVRLEAEIDAEIARDEAAAAAAASRMMMGSDGQAHELHGDHLHDDHLHGNHLQGDRLHGNDDDALLPAKDDDRHGNNAVDGRTRDAGVQTVDESLLEAAAAAVSPYHPLPLCSRKSSFSSISSSSDSSSVRGATVHPHQHPHPHHHHQTTQVPPAAAAAAATVPKRRPVIEVDMMSLDEMVRNILNKCTCEFQYPMIRVSEGKYKIGDSLTLIFVRILRNHVMVRIGGGWDTLENYLHRHDPCRMETKVTKSSSSHMRIGAHTCGGVGAVIGGTGVGGTGVGRTGEGWKDGSVSPSDKSSNDTGSFEENPVLETSGRYAAHNGVSIRPDDSITDQTPIVVSAADDLTHCGVTDSIQQSLQAETNDCANDEADRSTETPLLDNGRTRDVACQTDDPTRRYSSSSGASSWESTRGDEKCGRVGATGRIDVTLDVTVQQDSDNRNPPGIEYSNDSSTDPPSSRQDYEPERDSAARDSSQGKQGLGCPQCGQSAVHGKQTAGLCRLCRQRRGQLRPSSAKVTRQMPQCPSTMSHDPASFLGTIQDKRFRVQRPASAQEKQRHLPGLEGQLGIPRLFPGQQRPSSAQGQRPQRTLGSASIQKQRRRTLGPAVIQEHMTLLVASSSSTQGQGIRTATYTLGQDKPAKEQRRNSLGPVNVPGPLHQTPIFGLAQDPLQGQRPRQRPASAQEHRRFAKRSKEELFIPESTSGPTRHGENKASGFYPPGFSPHRPSTITAPRKAAVVAIRTKSEEDLRTEGCSATKGTVPHETPFQRRTSLRSTISSQGDRQLIRELFRMKKLDAGCGYDIPELVEQSGEDLPTSIPSQMRPRKDVGRTGSFSKIPKPVAMN